MLSHLLGAANRAEIRRLVALELENAELRERLERQQLRSQELLDERDRSAAQLRQMRADSDRERALAPALHVTDASNNAASRAAESAVAMVALQTERRDRAEQINQSTQPRAPSGLTRCDHRSNRRTRHDSLPLKGSSFNRVYLEPVKVFLSVDEAL